MGRGTTSDRTTTDRCPIWQARYYDFNVFTHNKRVEMLKYLYRNPPLGGVAERPEDWRWSSFRDCLCNEPTPIQITRV